MFGIQEPLRSKPKCRIELHVHLDGTIRHETIWELMRAKKLPLPGTGSLADLKNALMIYQPKNLCHFLSKFAIFMPAIINDLEAIERISFEFVEDLSRNSVLYAETRLCPHLLLPECHENGTEIESETGRLTVDDIMDTILAGLSRGENEFGTKVRLILCCVGGLPEWSWDILRLCDEYKSKGVVGIDLAGEESGMMQDIDLLAEVFDAAKEKGIHRTVHAGEDGGPETVSKALDLLHAERIGHGYRVLEDEKVYKRCLDERIHFEVCPHSSYFTGAINQLQTESKRHPVLRFSEDGASFSINTDDPTLTGTRLNEEYQLLQSWGFTESHFVRSNYEAVMNCFLPPDEKEELVNQLTKAFGIVSLVNSPSISPSGRKIEKVESVKPIVKMASWEDRKLC